MFVLTPEMVSISGVYLFLIDSVNRGGKEITFHGT